MSDVSRERLASRRAPGSSPSLIEGIDPHAEEALHVVGGDMATEYLLCVLAKELNTQQITPLSLASILVGVI